MHALDRYELSSGSNAFRKTRSRERLPRGGINPDGGGATGAGERLGEPATEDDALINCDTTMSDTDVVFRRHPFETCGVSLTAQDKHTLMVQFRDPYVAWAASLRIPVMSNT